MRWIAAVLVVVVGAAAITQTHSSIGRLGSGIGKMGSGGKTAVYIGPGDVAGGAFFWVGLRAFSRAYYVLGTSVAGGFNPADPGASGYTLTFADEFDSLSSIDVNNTGAAGYKWCVSKPFGFPTSPSNSFSVASGVLTIAAQTGDSQNWQMATACPSVSSPPYVGRTFGGSIYAEVRLSFTAASVNTANGWPAFWGEPIEHMLGTDQWPGQAAGYTHFGELDVFEYNQNDTTRFSSALHDWYGIYNSTCPPTYCGIYNSSNNVVTISPAPNWSNFHKIGALYVTGGYVFTYFDGSPTGVYNAWTAQTASPPPAGANLFSIFDQDHFAFILGTGIGQSINVDYVHIWRKTELNPVANDNQYAIDRAA